MEPVQKILGRSKTWLYLLQINKTSTTFPGFLINKVYSWFRPVAQLIPINDVCIFQEFETGGNSIIPPLPTARFYPTAFNPVLVVSRGTTHWKADIRLRTYTNAVEVFQTKVYQWYCAECLPVAHSGMSFSSFSVGFCVKKRRLSVTNFSSEVTCRHFDWILQSSSGRKWRGANKHYYL